MRSLWCKAFSKIDFCFVGTVWWTLRGQWNLPTLGWLARCTRGTTTVSPGKGCCQSGGWLQSHWPTASSPPCPTSGRSASSSTKWSPSAASRFRVCPTTKSWSTSRTATLFPYPQGSSPSCESAQCKIRFKNVILKWNWFVLFQRDSAQVLLAHVRHQTAHGVRNGRAAFQHSASHISLHWRALGLCQSWEDRLFGVHPAHGSSEVLMHSLATLEVHNTYTATLTDQTEWPVHK